MAGRSRERVAVLDVPRLPTPAPPIVWADNQPIVWTATGLERQVFLDNTGRRGRRVRLAGTGMALLSAGWLAALVTGAIGFSDLPSLPATAAGLRTPTTPAHVAVARQRHIRRRVFETADVNLTHLAAAHALARSETQGLGGSGG